MNIGAYFYNNSLKQHGGKLEAVLNVKDVPDRLAKAVVADYETWAHRRDHEASLAVGDLPRRLALSALPLREAGRIRRRICLRVM